MTAVSSVPSGECPHATVGRSFAHCNRLNGRVLINSHSGRWRSTMELTDRYTAHAHYVGSSRQIRRRQWCDCCSHLCQRKLFDVAVAKPVRFTLKPIALRRIDRWPSNTSKINSAATSSVNLGKKTAKLLSYGQRTRIRRCSGNDSERNRVGPCSPVPCSCVRLSTHRDRLQHLRSYPKRTAWERRSRKGAFIHDAPTVQGRSRR